MKTKSLFEQKLKTLRETYLENKFEGEDHRDQQKIKELERVTDKVRDKEIEVNKNKLKSLKDKEQKARKQQQKAKSNDSQL